MDKLKHRDRTALSPREAEIQALRLQGLRLQQIADNLGISYAMVRSYIASINARAIGKAAKEQQA